MSRTRPRLIVSAPGNEGIGGGVFAVSETGCELLDGLPSAGMAISPCGTRIARLTWVEGSTDVSELVISDQFGLVLYRRLDAVREPHSLVWRGSQLLAVSTYTNAIVYMDETGNVEGQWTPRETLAAGDHWHLNSLTEIDGRLAVSAFGRFDAPRGWAMPGALDGAGIVIDVETCATLLQGLSAPHDPTPLDDGWLVCNSGTGEVWRLDRGGRRIGGVNLGGWPRGVLIDGESVYVGVSAHRLAGASTRARIAVLDTCTLEEVGQLPLPGRDVFAITRWDEHLAHGLRIGAGLGALRDAGSSHLYMDDPLRDIDCALHVDLAHAPMRHGEGGPGQCDVTVRLTNRASVPMSGRGSLPVRVGLRHGCARDRWVDVGRADLPRLLAPGEAVDVTMRIDLAALDASGCSGVAHRIQICALQEHVRWFDDICPAAAVELEVARDVDVIRAPLPG